MITADRFCQQIYYSGNPSGTGLSININSEFLKNNYSYFKDGIVQYSTVGISFKRRPRLSWIYKKDVLESHQKVKGVFRRSTEICRLIYHANRNRLF